MEKLNPKIYDYIRFRGNILQSNKASKNIWVVFDVEGVILPKGHYLLFAAAKHLGIRGTLLLMILGLLYEVRLISLEAALRRIYRLFKGMRIDELYRTFENISMIPGSLEVFQDLKNKGYLTALISSGLPDIFVKALAKKLGTNYGYGLEFETNDGLLTGKLVGDVVKTNGKVLVLERLQQDEGFSADNCIIVADDRNNRPIIPLCGKSIGYNADFSLSKKVDYVVKGNLTEIVPYIEFSDAKTQFKKPSKNDYFRKTIHMGSYIIPIICKYFGIDTLIIAMILVVMIFYIVSEFYRLAGRKIPIFTRITTKSAIGDEIWDFAVSPIFFALGIIITLLLFKKPIGYVGITVLTLGDGAATIFGKKFGNTVLPLNKSKTMEGTIIGFIFAFFGSLIFIDPVRSLIAALVGTIMESLPLPINDNISIPILTSLSIALISP